MIDCFFSLEIEAFLKMISAIRAVHGSLSLERDSDPHDITHGIVDTVLWLYRLTNDRLLHRHGMRVGGVVFQPAGRGTGGTESVTGWVT